MDHCIGGRGHVWHGLHVAWRQSGRTRIDESVEVPATGHARDGGAQRVTRLVVRVRHGLEHVGRSDRVA